MDESQGLCNAFDDSQDLPQSQAPTAQFKKVNEDGTAAIGVEELKDLSADKKAPEAPGSGDKENQDMNVPTRQPKDKYLTNLLSKFYKKTDIGDCVTIMRTAMNQLSDPDPQESFRKFLDVIKACPILSGSGEVLKSFLKEFFDDPRFSNHYAPLLESHNFNIDEVAPEKLQKRAHRIFNSTKVANSTALFGDATNTSLQKCEITPMEIPSISPDAVSEASPNMEANFDKSLVSSTPATDAAKKRALPATDTCCQPKTKVFIYPTVLDKTDDGLSKPKDEPTKPLMKNTMCFTQTMELETIDKDDEDKTKDVTKEDDQKVGKSTILEATDMSIDESKAEEETFEFSVTKSTTEVIQEEKKTAEVVEDKTADVVEKMTLNFSVPDITENCVEPEVGAEVKNSKNTSKVLVTEVSFSQAFASPMKLPEAPKPMVQNDQENIQHITSDIKTDEMDSITMFQSPDSIVSEVSASVLINNSAPKSFLIPDTQQIFTDSHAVSIDDTQDQSLSLESGMLQKTTVVHDISDFSSCSNMSSAVGVLQPKRNVLADKENIQNITFGDKTNEMNYSIFRSPDSIVSEVSASAISKKSSTEQSSEGFTIPDTQMIDKEDVDETKDATKEDDQKVGKSTILEATDMSIDESKIEEETFEFSVTKSITEVIQEEKKTAEVVEDKNCVEPEVGAEVKNSKNTSKVLVTEVIFSQASAFPVKLPEAPEPKVQNDQENIQHIIHPDTQQIPTNLLSIDHSSAKEQGEGNDTRKENTIEVIMKESLVNQTSSQPKTNVQVFEYSIDFDETDDGLTKPKYEPTKPLMKNTMCVAVAIGKQKQVSKQM